MTAPHARTHPATDAEARAWADTLVCYGLLHAAIRLPGGKWLIQHRPEAPIGVLSGPAEVIELAAEIQHRTRVQETHIR